MTAQKQKSYTSNAVRIIQFVSFSVTLTRGQEKGRSTALEIATYTIDH